VLYNIGCGIFLKQPAGEDVAPSFRLGRAGGTLIDEQLHKCTLVRLVFPRRCFLASPESDNHFVEANSLAGFEFNVAGLAVSFVQQTQYGNAFCHWRANICAGHGNNFVVCGDRLAGFRGRKRFIL
jgi:hypothetical protein